MKKFLFLVLIIILFMLSFMPKQTNITAIKYATWGSQTEIEILKPLLSEFEKQNPDIKVELLHIPQNYFQKIHLLFASNSAPDVIFINNYYLPFFANANVLEPYERDLKEFENKALDALKFENKQYAIPRDISVIVIFRNKNLFKNCNVKLTSDIGTMKDFLEISEKFKKCGVFGISFEEKPPLFYLPYLMSEGGGILSDDAKTNILNSKNSQKGLKFYSDLRNKYYVAPTASESANKTMAQMFLQGKMAMHLTGHWLVPKYLEEASFEWDTVTFPKGSSGSVVSLDASGWAISKSSKHKDEAKKLVDFLSSKDSIQKYTQSGLIVPARKDILKGEFANSPYNKAFINAVQTAKPTPVSVDYNELINRLNQENEKVFNVSLP